MRVKVRTLYFNPNVRHHEVVCVQGEETVSAVIDKCNLVSYPQQLWHRRRNDPLGKMFELRGNLSLNAQMVLDGDTIEGSSNGKWEALLGVATALAMSRRDQAKEEEEDAREVARWNSISINARTGISILRNSRHDSAAYMGDKEWAGGQPPPYETSDAMIEDLRTGTKLKHGFDPWVLECLEESEREFDEVDAGDLLDPVGHWVARKYPNSPVLTVNGDGSISGGDGSGGNGTRKLRKSADHCEECLTQAGVERPRPATEWCARCKFRLCAKHDREVHRAGVLAGHVRTSAKNAPKLMTDYDVQPYAAPFAGLIALHRASQEGRPSLTQRQIASLAQDLCLSDLSDATSPHAAFLSIMKLIYSDRWLLQRESAPDRDNRRPDLDEAYFYSLRGSTQLPGGGGMVDGVALARTLATFEERHRASWRERAGAFTRRNSGLEAAFRRAQRSPQSPWRLVLLVDTAENQKYRVRLRQIFEKHGMQDAIEERALKTGDFMWILRHGGSGVEKVLPLIIERKTYSDLVSSLSDRRLPKQEYKMLASGCAMPTLLIEGKKNAFDSRNKAKKAEEMVERLQLVEGISVINTAHFLDTARRLLQMTWMLSERYHDGDRLRLSMSAIETNLRERGAPKTPPARCEQPAEEPPVFTVSAAELSTILEQDDAFDTLRRKLRGDASVETIADECGHVFPYEWRQKKPLLIVHTDKSYHNTRKRVLQQLIQQLHKGSIGVAELDSRLRDPIRIGVHWMPETVFSFFTTLALTQLQCQLRFCDSLAEAKEFETKWKRPPGPDDDSEVVAGGRRYVNLRGAAGAARGTGAASSSSSSKARNPRRSVEALKEEDLKQLHAFFLSAGEGSKKVFDFGKAKPNKRRERIISIIEERGLIDAEIRFEAKGPGKLVVTVHSSSASSSSSSSGLGGRRSTPQCAYCHALIPPEQGNMQQHQFRCPSNPTRFSQLDDSDGDSDGGDSDSDGHSGGHFAAQQSASAAGVASGSVSDKRNRTANAAESRLHGNAQQRGEDELKRALRASKLEREQPNHSDDEQLRAAVELSTKTAAHDEERRRKLNEHLEQAIAASARNWESSQHESYDDPMFDEDDDFAGPSGLGGGGIITPGPTAAAASEEEKRDLERAQQASLAYIWTCLGCDHAFNSIRQTHCSECGQEGNSSSSSASQPNVLDADDDDDDYFDWLAESDDDCPNFPEKWPCVQCTYVNKPGDQKCFICESARANDSHSGDGEDDGGGGGGGGDKIEAVFAPQPPKDDGSGSSWNSQEHEWSHCEFCDSYFAPAELDSHRCPRRPVPRMTTRSRVDGEVGEDASRQQGTESNEIPATDLVRSVTLDSAHDMRYGSGGESLSQAVVIDDSQLSDSSDGADDSRVVAKAAASEKQRGSPKNCWSEDSDSHNGNENGVGSGGADDRLNRRKQRKSLCSDDSDSSDSSDSGIDGGGGFTKKRRSQPPQPVGRRRQSSSSSSSSSSGWMGKNSQRPADGWMSKRSQSQDDSISIDVTAITKSKKQPEKNRTLEDVDTNSVKSKRMRMEKEPGGSTKGRKCGACKLEGHCRSNKECPMYNDPSEIQRRMSEKSKPKRKRLSSSPAPLSDDDGGELGGSVKRARAATAPDLNLRATMITVATLIGIENPDSRNIKQLVDDSFEQAGMPVPEGKMVDKIKFIAAEFGV